MSVFKGVLDAVQDVPLLLYYYFAWKSAKKKRQQPVGVLNSVGDAVHDAKASSGRLRAFSPYQRQLQRRGRRSRRCGVFIPDPSILHDDRVGKIRSKSTVERLRQRLPRRRRRRPRRRVGFPNLPYFGNPINTQPFSLRKITYPLRKSATLEPPNHLQSTSKHQIEGGFADSRSSITTIHQQFIKSSII